MRYNQPALVSLHRDIMDIRARAAEPVEISAEPLPLRDRLELDRRALFLSAGRARGAAGL